MWQHAPGRGPVSLLSSVLWYVCLIIGSPFDWHGDRFLILAFMNKPTTNIRV